MYMIVSHINTLLCPNKANNNTMEITVQTSCYCISILDYTVLILLRQNSNNKIFFENINWTECYDENLNTQYQVFCIQNFAREVRGLNSHSMLCGTFSVACKNIRSVLVTTFVQLKAS